MNPRHSFLLRKGHHDNDCIDQPVASSEGPSRPWISSRGTEQFAREVFGVISFTACFDVIFYVKERTDEKQTERTISELGAKLAKQKTNPVSVVDNCYGRVLLDRGVGFQSGTRIVPHRAWTTAGDRYTEQPSMTSGVEFNVGLNSV